MYNILLVIAIINITLSVWWAVHGEYALLTGNFMVLGITCFLCYLLEGFIKIKGGIDNER